MTRRALNCWVRRPVRSSQEVPRGCASMYLGRIWSSALIYTYGVNGFLIAGRLERCTTVSRQRSQRNRQPCDSIIIFDRGQHRRSPSYSRCTNCGVSTGLIGRRRFSMLVQPLLTPCEASSWPPSPTPMVPPPCIDPAVEIPGKCSLSAIPELSFPPSPSFVYHIARYAHSHSRQG